MLIIEWDQYGKKTENKKENYKGYEQHMGSANTTTPTDLYIPQYLKEAVPELASLTSLQEKETMLDRFLVRKKIELEELAQNTGINIEDEIKSNKILRVYVSNLATDQPWQNPETQDPTWTLRVEGRLLDSSFKADDPNRPKFSSFLSSIALDFEKEQLTEGQEPDPFAKPLEVVEWHENPHGPPVEFDGLDVKRSGSRNVKCKITIQPKYQTADILEYSEPLSQIVCRKNGSLQSALFSVYTYITSNEYFDANGNISLSSDLLKKLVHSNKVGNTTNNLNGTSAINGNNLSEVSQNNTLSSTPVAVNNSTSSINEQSTDQVSQQQQYENETISLSELNDMITKDHVRPVPPLSIDYTIRCDKASTYGETCFDIIVKGPETLNQKHTNKYSQLLEQYLGTTKSIDTGIKEADSKINELMVELNNVYHRHQFYTELSKDPVNFLTKYIEASSNMMKVLSGDEGFQEDEVRKSEFYKKNANILYEDIAIMFANGRI